MCIQRLLLIAGEGMALSERNRGNVELHDSKLLGSDGIPLRIYSIK